MRARRVAILVAGAFAALAAAGPAQALGAPVLNIASTHVPASASVPAGSYAKYTLAVSNVGSSATTASENVDVKFSVPAGLEITGVSAEEPFEFEAWSCSVAVDSLSASCEGPALFGSFKLPFGPGREACEEFFEEEFGTSVRCHIFVIVKADPNATPSSVHPTIEACGGGAASCAGVDDPVEISPPAGFGIRKFDGQVLDENGDPETQAGSHPSTASTEFSINTVIGPEGNEWPVQDLKDVVLKLPPGVLANPQALPTCAQSQLFIGDFNGLFNCPIESQVGLVQLEFTEGGVSAGTGLTALFNMKTQPGSPALLSFNYGNTLVQGYVKVRTGEDYGATVIFKNSPETLSIGGVTTTVWGVPADPAHDPDRVCLPDHSFLERHGEHNLGCESADAAHPKPFFTLPTSCEGPGPNDSVETFLELISWFGSSGDASFLSHDNSEPEPNPIGTTGCNAIDFSPTLEARPTTNVADAASGLDVDLHVPQHEACDTGPPVSCETAEASLRDTTVTLPQGMSVNPSGANGLGICSETQFGFTDKEGDTIHTTADPASCPDQAKIGTVEVDSPLVDHPLKGAVYIATPYQNPFDSLLAIYINIDDPQTGVVVKLAGEVHADPNTGQLTTTVLHNPQLPFEDFKLHFKGGAHGTLRTPAACRGYSTTSSLTPWSAPESGPPATPGDSWTIERAAAGGQCPTSPGAQPNTPNLDAGSVSPVAGISAPTVVTLRREDGSQEFSTVNLTLPPGMTGKLAGIPACPDAALATAASKSGHDEEASPSCPVGSRIGTVYVAAGAGPSPYNTQGATYLTGPYKGAPLGMAIITPATAGPFDLGTVVVRVALHLDPSTGQITANSDPIPAILQGIPLDVRSASVRLDRPSFTRNGTSCNPAAFNGSLLSTLGQAAPLSERFQLGECTGLAFKPKLGIRLTGGTKRGSHPALKGTVTMPEGGANIAKAIVALPHSEFLDQGHIGTVCTRVQFAEGDGNGSACPAASIYGHAVGTSPLVDYPLEGNAYLRSSSNKLPDLVVALHGPASQPVAVDVVGRIDSVKGGIRTSFEGVPDLPVSSFVLSMEGGKKGLLQNSTNICKGVHKATAEFDAQNGKAADLTPVLKNGKCRPAKAHRKKNKRRDRHATPHRPPATR